ncbi:MAG: GNAT family N-acetyltransferase [Pseudomonas sp.]
MNDLTSPASWTIRVAKPLDAEAIFSVHKDSVASLCSGSYLPQQIAQWMDGRSSETYLNAITRGEIHVAVSAGHIVGFVEATSGEIVKLFVRGSAAGIGIGSRLMSAGIKLAQRGHHGPIRIESTKNAESFYAKFGFFKVGSGTFSRGGSSIPIEIVHLLGDF